nr:helix-turn-helix transcriptional regulator [uncultured Duganella sp.]
MSIVGKRLKEARIRVGLSQEQLGVQAGIDEASASARMNRYERGTRSPTIELIGRIAQVLGLPVAYFYSEDDSEATLLVAFHALSEDGKKTLLSKAQLLFDARS